MSRPNPSMEKTLSLLKRSGQGVSLGEVEEWLRCQDLKVPSRPTLIKYMEVLAKDHPVERIGQGRATRYYYRSSTDRASKSSLTTPSVSQSNEELGHATLVMSDNLQWLQDQPDDSFDLIYIDPPFNTGKTQKRTATVAMKGSGKGHTGFGGQQYERRTVGDTISYLDRFDNFISDFLGPRLEQAYRILSPQGSLFLHLDPRESHYAKVFLDMIFGRSCFRNEIIWSYDYGARSKNRWSAKHDTILWYSKDPKKWTFNYEAIDRIPYMAPGLVGAEKAARGKTPTDVWWNTIVSPTGREKTGYPTQKPLAILERIVTVHSNPEGRLLDFFAGSGSFGHAAVKHGRSCVLVDESPQACATIIKRFDTAGLPLTGKNITG